VVVALSLELESVDAVESVGLDGEDGADEEIEDDDDDDGGGGADSTCPCPCLSALVSSLFARRGRMEVCARRPPAANFPSVRL
jgi:hypothetical protein